MPDLLAAAAELGAILPEPALVVGSLPDDASDLDLLVRPAAHRALRDWLPAAGYGPWGDGWLRVAGGTAVVVDLEPAAAWQLSAAALQALFDDAVPLPGLPGLVEPSPHHALLVLARRLAGSGGRLDARRLGRARRALTADPDAFAAAAAAAEGWRCAGALEVLERDLAGTPVTAAEVRALLAADAVRIPPAWREAARRAVPARRGRGVVLGVSGLDGAGKSTLVDGLVDALDSTGFETAVLWHRLSYGKALVRLAAPVKAVARLAGRGPGPADDALQPLRPGPAAPPSTAAQLWPVVVTVVHVLSAGPAVRWHLRRGRVVVRDRDALDAAVHLADRYGPAAPDRLHLSLLRRALPRPALAWFLDVPAEEARRRKPEQYAVAALDRQRRLYLERAPRLGVQVLDGTRAPSELREDVIRQTLEVLVRAGVPRR